MTGERDAVPSPCVDRCCLDERKICVGCFRTLEEIIAWTSADDEHKRRILARVARRRSGCHDDAG